MIKDNIYLQFGYAPKHNTTVICDNCNHVLNAGPNYKPRFCDMCGAPIKENLDKINWNTNDASWLEYVEYELAEHPDYLIVKVRYECTDDGLIGLPKTAESCPVLIGKSMEDILKFANERGSKDYAEEDFEPATKAELYAHAKICGKYWRG